MAILKPFAVRKSLLVNTNTESVTVVIASNDAIQLPVGTTADRPTGANGMFRYNTDIGGFEGFIGGAWTYVSDSTTAGDMDTTVYDVAGVSEQIAGITATQTLTNKTLTSPTLNSPNFSAGAFDSIDEFASSIKTGVGNYLMTGTSGTSGDLVLFDAQGDLVDGPTPPSGTIVGTSDTQTLTNKTLTSPTINSPNMGVNSVDAITEIASALKSGNNTTLITGTAGGSNIFGKWNIDGDLIGGPTVPSGLLVGTTDIQTLTNKTFTSPLLTLGSDASGDIYYRNGSGNVDRLPIGAQEEVLTITNNLPAWEVLESNVSPTFIRFGNVVSKTINTAGGIAVTSSWNKVSNYGAAEFDQLVNIGAGANGDYIIIKGGNTSQFTTVKHKTGNIRLKGGIDALLGANTYLTLIYDGVKNEWIEIARSGSNRVRSRWTDSKQDLAAKSTYSFNNVNFGEASTDRVLVLWATIWENSTTITHSSTTIGGITGSLAWSQLRYYSSFAVRNSMFSARVPSGTTGTVSLAFTTTLYQCYISLIALYGCKYDTARGANSGVGSSYSIVSKSLSVPAGGIIIGGCGGHYSSSVQLPIISQGGVIIAAGNTYSVSEHKARASSETRTFKFNTNTRNTYGMASFR